MPNPQPYWPWCPQPGAARQTTLAVDEVNYGDGYKHRSTRGLNPVRPAWSLTFPFTSLAELDERDQFLRANATNGFWFTPPDGAAPLFVTANEWAANITERNLSTGIVGTLNVVLTQSFNPQFPGASAR